MITYSLEPSRDTLIESFSREHPPILTIDPGDRVRYRTTVPAGRWVSSRGWTISTLSSFRRGASDGVCCRWNANRAW
jgi:hypothetical protein